MTLIEGIGDEVTHFFIALIIIVLVSLAWWTTSIPEQSVRSVFLWDPRRNVARRILTNHTQSITIAAGISTSDTGDTNPSINTVPEPSSSSEVSEAVSKPPEAGCSASSQLEVRPQEEEQNRIVATMDASDTNVLRERRLAFYNRNVNSNGTEENEHNYAEKPNSNEEFHDELNTEKQSNSADRDSSEIRIKLKYINDDLKLVDGKLSELLGDFKKRHFQVEMAANKLVRLIFNGQVLHRDGTTLEQCGFFDNCVVHCLIHQIRSSQNEETNADNHENPTNHNRTFHQNSINNNNNNNNQGREWDLGNVMFAFISISLLSAWFLRYVYAHLYTSTATVGLILMTGVFTVLLFGFYFPDDITLTQRMDNNPQTQQQPTLTAQS